MENDKKKTETSGDLSENLKSILEDLEKFILEIDPSDENITQHKEDIMAIKSFLHLISKMQDPPKGDK